VTVFVEVFVGDGVDENVVECVDEGVTVHETDVVGV
jgi:hypothetical protein